MGKLNVVSGIEPDKNLDPLTTEEREDLFTKLVMGKDVTTDVVTSRGTFTIKYPKPKDTLAIGRLVSFRRNNYPIESFDTATESINIMVSTLDIVVVSGPPWFERAKKSSSNWDWTMVPDIKFLRELYEKVSTFRLEVESGFDKTTTRGDTSLSTTKNTHETVDSGVFGNLTG
jgi:hypothetical protein